MFTAVTGNLIGDYGSLGGGVVGQEWDSAAGHALGTEHLILACSRNHTLVPPLFDAIRPDYHADLVLYINSAGTVFSVSFMALGRCARPLGLCQRHCPDQLERAAPVPRSSAAGPA